MTFFSRLCVTLALGITLLLPHVGSAKELGGVHIEESFSTPNTQLVLNGAGIRSKFFMDLYVASLYTPKASQQVEVIIDSPVLAIRLDIVSTMITSDKMNAAINDGFKNATQGNTQAIEGAIEAFMATFNAPINVGDHFIFILEKDQGVSSIKNGQPQGQIQDETFRQALVKIWLGDEPAQQSLKEAMLGLG